MGRLLLLLMFGLLSLHGAHAQVINYPNGFAGSTGQIWLENTTVLSGAAIDLTQSGSAGLDNNAWYETPVNVQAFTTSFTFVESCPADCGEGFGFMIISLSNPSSLGYSFSAGNGPQFSWSQCGGTGNTDCAAINSVLVKFDLYDAQTGAAGANLTGFYSGGSYPQAPNNPQYDMAASGINMESGDLMRATLSYNGTVLKEIVTDTVTGASFTNTYTADIPSLVGGNTAYVGFGGSTGTATVTQSLMSWAYAVESPGQAAIPMFSPAAGSYFGAQTVALSSASSGAVICYSSSGSPATNGAASCTAGTLYTGPVTVSSSETLYAVAGGTGFGDSPVVSASYVMQNAVSAPVFSPAAGTYTSVQSVAVSDATSNATIYYTTDGSTPTTASTRYAGPVSVGTTETLKAIGFSTTGNASSAVTSAAYTINLPTAVATPVFSPLGGTYTAVQSVDISDTTSGATIYYTTDGSTPTTASTRYAGPVMVSATETLQAIAVLTGDTNSAVAAASYTINLEPSVATPVFSPRGGTYGGAQSVTISDATANATIYYTTDGSTPTTASTAYTSAITVGATETLKAVAVAAGDNNSVVGYAAYNITRQSVVATPIFSPIAGTYPPGQSVTISDATAGATLYYTTDGSAPTTSSTRYTGPLTVPATETLAAISVAAGESNSAVSIATYTISAEPVVATPTFSPAAGAYNSAQSVTIACATSGATIYYTTNGTAPTTSSARYTGAITVSATETLEALAAASGDANSTVAVAAYTISAESVVATPTFSPAAGTYSSAQSVTIADVTAGATIYYTTDGTMPTPSSIAYTTPITVSSTQTLEAFAVASGEANSAVASAVYTISTALPTVATPAFSPAAGTYSSAQAVTISDATSGATIYYTTNGTIPTPASTAYSGAITVSSTETVEAIAVAAGETNSAVASAAYTITAMPGFTLGASPASVTVDSGESGTVTLTVTPENGFAAAVSFACTGLPVGATCSFSPAMVTPSSAAVTTVLTIAVSAQSSALPAGSRPLLPLTTLALTVGLWGWRSRRRWQHWMVLAVAAVGLGLLFGCGGGGGGGTTSPTPPTPTTSTVTVTATSGALQETAAISLTEN